MSAHFDAGDAPGRTLLDFINQQGKKDTDVTIFGGNDNAASNNTLQQCTEFLNANGMPFSYINSSGLYIDQNGQLYEFQGSGPNKSEGNK